MSLHRTELGRSGSRVVLCHGLFGQGKNWTQAAKALSTEHRVLLLDMPNHGRSPWTERFDYVELADLVAAELGDEPAALVGHSMGGKIAMCLALRHPELVERLVVVDIAPAVSEGAREFEHLLDSLASLDLTALERRGDADEQLAERIDDVRVRGFLLQNLRSGGDGFRWQANLDLLRRDLAVIGGFPDIEASFDRPVLWIAGERSPYIQPEHGETMRRLFPKVRSVTVKGAGHWVHSEKPEAFVTILQAFLRG